MVWQLMIAIVVLFLSACATVQVVETLQIEEKVGKVPPIGQNAEAPTGGTVFSQFRYWQKTGYRIMDYHSQALALGRVSVGAGDFVVRAVLENENVFCTEKRAYIDPMVGPHAIACFLDRDNDGRFEKVKTAPGGVWFERDVFPPFRYEKSELIVPRSDAFKYELLYQGVSKDTLRLSYREFLNEFARPAFFQDVTYDIEERPSTITFRAVKIEVLDADNNKIVYRVLSGF